MNINQELFWEKVNKTETCWVWTAAMAGKGYGTFSVNRRQHRVHRLAYELLVGPIGKGMEVDHLCHNRACVNPDHLRTVTHKQNLENRAGAQSNSKSGVRGVYWIESSQRWRTQINHGGRYISAGVYRTKAEAEAAVIAKRNELFTHNDIDRKEAA